MTRSLALYGLAAQDEADLIFYFNQPDEPKDWAAAARWKPVHQFFTERMDDRTSELEGQFRQFYSNGHLRSWGATAAAALREFNALFPHEPMPPHIQRGAPGGRELVEWEEKEKLKPTFNRWLHAVYDREDRGTNSAAERRMLDEIAREKASELDELVRRFNGRKGWLERQIAREEREKREQERLAQVKTAAVPQAKRQSHRRYGELPPEPEVFIRRKPL